MSLSSRIEILEGHENSLFITATPTAVPRHQHDLSGDQPPAVLDDSILAEVKAALDNGQTHYAPVAGIPALRQAPVRPVRIWIQMFS